MTKVLVCQHVDYEILGTLDPLLQESHIDIGYVNFGRNPNAEPSLDGYDGLILLGGSMNIGEEDQFPHLLYERSLIKDGLKRDIPILGICLGAQLVAATLGARVQKLPQMEIGWYDIELTEAGKKDPLFKDFKHSEKIFEWHGYGFELPKDAIYLASSKECPYQAFRYGEKVYAFQYHLEVDQAMIERWLGIPEMHDQLIELYGVDAKAFIKEQTHKCMKHSEDLSTLCFGAFLDLIAK